jgi:hypothetical protein
LNIPCGYCTERKTCGRPPLLEHGRWQLSRRLSLYNVGQSVSYSCEQGYILQGPSILSCSTKGEWVASSQECATNKKACL